MGGIYILSIYNSWAPLDSTQQWHAADHKMTQRGQGSRRHGKKNSGSKSIYMWNLDQKIGIVVQNKYYETFQAENIRREEESK